MKVSRLTTLKHKNMSHPSKTVLDINDPEVKYLMSALLHQAYLNGPEAEHDPLAIWKSLTGPKPHQDTIMPLLEYMEKFDFVTINGESGFGRYCDFKLTYKSKKIYMDGMQAPSEPRKPMGF